LLLVFAIAVFSRELPAQEKTPAKPEPPVVKLAVPPTFIAGTTTKFVLRGLKLNPASEVRIDLDPFPDLLPTLKLLSQGAANVPNQQKADKIGDQQIELELVLPQDFPDGPLPLRVLTPGGTSTHALVVGSRYPRTSEKEPNDGFRQAQLVSVPQVIDGTLHQGQNVDVFAIDGPAGGQLRAEVFAARLGSGLDPLLTLYSASGQIVSQRDDLPDSVDCRLELRLPSAGRYYLSLQDAHDQGGPAHPYRLELTWAE